MTLPWELPFTVGGGEPTPQPETSPEVKFILSQLPEDADKYGWNAENIQAMLDAGLSPTKIIAAAWGSIAAQTYSMVDVQESGSSRSLSTIHNNARAMADFWAEKAKAEDAAKEDPNDKARGRVAFHKATRV